MPETISVFIRGPLSAVIKEDIRQQAMQKGLSVSEFIVACIMPHLRKELSNHGSKTRRK